MKRTLRGHHLLCVHGFQGMGYSPAFVEKMSEIVQDIRNDRLDFPIRVIEGLDEACRACPHHGIGRCEASEQSDAHVRFLDRNVIEHLGLEKGKEYPKSLLIALTATKVRPEDLDSLCKGCSWLSYGICKQGIQKLREKYFNEVGDSPAAR
ncbi:MAG: DUF1284 domain-containing protein [Bacillus sp. (in: Bacteria)]|jgi:uncharacterized protein|nr:DUF1284 domain-containing protein [Bacillus sp. (in: firmicutes)]